MVGENCKIITLNIYNYFSSLFENISRIKVRIEKLIRNSREKIQFSVT